MGMTRRTFGQGAAGLALAGCGSGAGAPEPRFPIVIAHRGASGERPEHTLAAYRLGIEQGADFIEPDLVLTRDGALVCRHENEISETTDVAVRPEFAGRRSSRLIDGQTVSGWFTEDFTLAELKTLRCKERLAQLRVANTAFDGQETIPTFDEVVALANAEGIGVYPELKHPAYFEGLGLDPLGALVQALRRGELGLQPDRVFVQCFEIGPLQRLASMSGSQIRCIQLIAAEGAPADGEGLTYADLIAPEGLKRISGYAYGIGAQKSLIIPRDGAERSLPATDLVRRAHDEGLKVHAWTFRSENFFLPDEFRAGPDPQVRGDGRAELEQFFAAGVDGVFCDHPEDGFEARQAWSAAQ